MSATLAENVTTTLATQVVQICRTVLEDAGVTVDSTTATVERWDSLGHMNLITALEAHFGVELDVMEMAEVDSVAGLIAVVQNAVCATPDAAGGSP